MKFTRITYGQTHDISTERFQFYNGFIILVRDKTSRNFVSQSSTHYNVIIADWSGA